MSADAGVPLTVVVTGATAGLGYWHRSSSRRAGHRVVLAARNPDRAAAAIESIRSWYRGQRVEHVALDLADLDSVGAAAARTRRPAARRHRRAREQRRRGRLARATVDRAGHELQVGTNHLGHFALTARVLPLVERRAGRVVHLGSIAHRWARLDRTDPLGAGHYSSYRQYGRSKLAVMLFGFELAERLADAGSSVASVVAHPGFSLDVLAPDRPLVSATRAEPAWTRPRAAPVRPGQGRRRRADRARGGRSGRPVRGVLWGPDGRMQLRDRPHG